MKNNLHKQQYLAAVDLGSNSFHMVVARIEDGHVHILDNLKEMVRLGAGLGKDGRLSSDSQRRALLCLERFGERVEGFPLGSVAAVGTNTLRQAKDSRLFLQKASEKLGHPISVIGGKEEARLVYLGVSHSLVAEQGKRFVMDIGGGSTELIVGENFKPLLLRSLNMGCVSMSRRFFQDGNTGKKCWKKAGVAAHLKLRPVRRYFQNVDWFSATGASGTIKAVGNVVNSLGLESYTISLDSLYRIRDIMIKAENIHRLDLPGLKSDREAVFAGGLAVLIACFEALKICTMRVSDGALREGLLYDRLGRIRSEDTRLKTIASVQRRFKVSRKHAARVSKTAGLLFTACAPKWSLKREDEELLQWACSLHEIGLSVSLSGYQKHGAYFLENADLPGFSMEEQIWMSLLVRCHRKKISKNLCGEFSKAEQQKGLRLVVLLRLAALLHRSRKDETAVLKSIIADDKGLTLCFVEGALIKHPLQLASLEQEAKYLKKVDFELRFSS